MDIIMTYNINKVNKNSIPPTPTHSDMGKDTSVQNVAPSGGLMYTMLPQMVAFCTESCTKWGPYVHNVAPNGGLLYRDLRDK